MVPELPPTEIAIVATADGWQLPLYHHAADGPPVLLVHGMGANHYNFDYTEEISLSHALMTAGYDVWVVALRGDPDTTAPSRRAARSITFDDYVRGDIAAIVDEVLLRTDREQLLWVGHSLGGMLLYAWLSVRPETIAAGVAVASPAVFTEPLGRDTVESFVSALPARGNLPTTSLMRTTAWLGRSHPSYGRIANPDNLDPALSRRLARHAIADIPIPLEKQAQTWAHTGTLSDTEGNPWIPEDSAADVPLLVLGAPDDRVVGEGNVRAACALFPDCTYVLLAQSQGFSSDYGHADPLVGIRAADEVYPAIRAFLDAHTP